MTVSTSPRSMRQFARCRIENGAFADLDGEIVVVDGRAYFLWARSTNSSQREGSNMDWKEHGVKIVHAGELDMNTPQTSGMTRAAAITHARTGAEKLWADR